VRSVLNTQMLSVGGMHYCNVGKQVVRIELLGLKGLIL
jgi:hypothetical protein